ncbi:hypothetical protein BD309DRAFT_985596 [Dichomitus squalens]|uniref:Uncharacterized protein n=1 Tax=Dichomitus squalens TaxID=114155 RepID=A0A4Q9PBC3_9APHY|nr:uncharacterized protein DICSQDRAFT_135321 [Dichomitus squalens LYAD-421 SS1]EJF63067.1 hypothetical protein DICSQDRAFT_135321 [Dichomitus squalens LYAD-421 SS1]TBU50517.1 hypothetical protein BD309DRAFT_985596 [Dichomitus squalens]TBU61294.1 hypothetical protein BD310DRAFT_813542 [Dichomitus squalens]
MASSGLPTSDPSRLPAYRFSHLGRFHPYPRSAPRRAEDALMQTVDYRTRTGLDPILEEPEPVRIRPLVVCQEIPDGDVSSFELDYPVVGDTEFFDQNAAAPMEVGGGLKAGLLHLLVALRRRSLALLAAGAFLKGERWTK